MRKNLWPWEDYGRNVEKVRYKKRVRLKGFAYKGRYRYFLTLCTTEDHRPFTGPGLINRLVEILYEVSTKCGFTVLAYCFMPDHLHLLVERTGDESDMRRFVALFKQKSGFYYNRLFGRILWQINYYDHVLRNEEDTDMIANYILANPVREGLVADQKDYPFSGTLAPGLSLNS